MDAGGDAGSVKRFEELRAQGIVKQRVNVAQTIDAELARTPKDALESMEEGRAAVNPDSGVSVRTAKVFMDGGIRSGMQPCARVSTVSRRLVKRTANGERGHTVTHIQFCDRADVPRFARLGVIANMQIQWASQNSYTLDSLEPYVRPELFARMYPLGELHAAEAHVSGGSDWPVDALSPWNQVGTAVDRIGTLSETGVALGADQAIDLETSITMHTRGSAYQLFSEHQTGVLAPGMLADLVVLDQDLMTVAVDGVSSSVVKYTIIGGEVVHEPSMIAQSSGVVGIASPAAASTASFFDRHRHCHHRLNA